MEREMNLLVPFSYCKEHTKTYLIKAGKNIRYVFCVTNH